MEGIKEQGFESEDVLRELTKLQASIMIKIDFLNQMEMPENEMKKKQVVRITQDVVKGVTEIIKNNKMPIETLNTQ